MGLFFKGLNAETRKDSLAITEELILTLSRPICREELHKKNVCTLGRWEPKTPDKGQSAGRS